MDLMDAITQRKSTRAFRETPVSWPEIRHIIRAGVASPSKGNSQIWEFVAVTGAKKKAMDAVLLELLRTDLIPSMSLGERSNGTESGALTTVEQRAQRNKEEIGRILEPLGTNFDTFMLEGTFTFFSAPVAILVFADQAFAKDLPHILSVGSAVQNMLLAATDRGLGTCWIGGVWRYTQNIRSLLGIPSTKRLLSSVALGYPDTDSPINQYKASRDEVESFVTKIGFGPEEV